MKPDIDAPAYYQVEKTINAPIKQVYELLTDVNNWPEWRTDVKEAQLAGPFQPGTEFTWVSGSSKLTSKLVVVEPNHTITWTGKSMGISVVHVWHFKDVDGAKTLVSTEESMSGLVVRLMRPFIKKVLARALDTALSDIQTKTE